MEQATRNKLRKVVTQCRKLLEESISQQLEGQFGIRAGKKDAVQIEDEARMSHLSEEDQQYRRDLLDHLEHIKARSFSPKDSLDQLIREIAFTHLNRLCAYKMMEAREVYVGGQKFRECVSRGINSNGFKFYLADHPDDERLFNTGDQETAYRHFLDWVGGSLSEEIGVLFHPNDPANRLYPRQKTLDELLDLLNDDELSDIWEQDETIGWVYQYFTPKELRDKARKESQAPRNSYELAFRNQFFTPRYVVEFLTDNTLGRIWYEMRKGDTKLKDQCRYMVRRPTEIFLNEGQEPPETPESQDDLSQEELLKQPVHIPHRPKKDPRELKILDPASGSGHFLLYCFDLLLTIYEEAYTDLDLGPALQQDYDTLDDLRRDVPRLILAHNLHGIDIDLRATQIAALALWLRSQRAYQEMGFKKDRPKITRSNLVCAEPMPGEEALLDEFLKTLHEDRLEQLIRRVMDVPEDRTVRTTPEMADRLCELVHLVWDKMKLAGEAGSLLKIEEDIQEAIRTGQEEWEEQQPLFRVTQYALTEEPQEKFIRVVPGVGVSFWERAEALVLAALDDFAAYATNGRKLLRNLFVDDAMRGFAFVDVCRQRFDVVLMNPPFGEASKPSKPLLEKTYPRTKNDVYAAFVERGIHRLHWGGILGAITSRTGFFLSSFQKWREEILLNDAPPATFADLGHGVLDTAMVETAAYCLTKGGGSAPTIFFRLLQADDKEAALGSAVDAYCNGEAAADVFNVAPGSFGQVPGSPFAYWVSDQVRRLFRELSAFGSDGRFTRVGLQTSDDFRFIRCWWEVASQHILDALNGPKWRQSVAAVQEWCRKRTFDGKRWVSIAKGGTFSPFSDPPQMVVNWERDGEEIKAWADPLYGNSGWSRIIKSVEFYFRPGLTWPLRGIRLSVQAVPSGCCFSVAGKLATSDDGDELVPLLGLMNSLTFDYLVGFFAGKVGGVQYEVGLIGKIPVPKAIHNAKLTHLSREASRVAAYSSTFKEKRHVFVVPHLLTGQGYTLAERLSFYQQQMVESHTRLVEGQRQLDELAFHLYGIGFNDRAAMEKRLLPKDAESDAKTESADNPETLPDVKVVCEVQAVKEMISYAVGCILGRWDVHFATGEKVKLDLPDPFDPLPVCSPGMLQGPDGLPATNTPEGYPVRIDWDGILVDDAGHQDDIVRRVREVLEVIWKDRADAIEMEVCEILAVKTLRDYFRKPGKSGFWDDHVKRYSKSRRKAPIYWLLQSSKKNYALWLYYHRLDKDMLFKALLNYVEPKIQREENRLAELRSQKSSDDSGKAAKKTDREIENQEDLLTELHDFEEKLRKVADLHLVPDLNDGVVLNIAPLHELVPWKEAKKYWNELMDGKYEWSSIGKQLREKGLVK